MYNCFNCTFYIDSQLRDSDGIWF